MKRKRALLGSNLPRNRIAGWRATATVTGSDCCSDESYVEVTMLTLSRKLLLGTGSVLALGIAGSIVDSVLDGAEVGNTATAASIPAVVATSRDALTGDALRRDDIRWAQVQLRYRGLYQGSLDGIAGPETKRALNKAVAILTIASNVLALKRVLADDHRVAPKDLQQSHLRRFLPRGPFLWSRVGVDRLVAFEHLLTAGLLEGAELRRGFWTSDLETRA
jgi:hypothetical protein